MSKDTRKINMIDANKPGNETKHKSVSNIFCETKRRRVNNKRRETKRMGVNNEGRETK